MAVLPLRGCWRRSRRSVTTTTTTTVLVLLVITCGRSLAGSVTEIGSKAELSSFVEAAKNEGQWVLLDFYAPWCQHCKRLNPVLDEFAADRDSVRVGKIDATTHKSLATLHRVDGYPTLRFALRDDFRDYKGPRDLEGFETLDARLSSPPVGDDVAEALKREPRVAFVGSDLEPAALAIFEAVAKDRFHETSFVLSSGKQQGMIAVVDENSTYAYGGKVDFESLKSWVKKHNAPAFNEPLGPGIFRRVSTARSVIAAVVDPSNDAHKRVSESLKTALLTLKPALRERFAAGEIDGVRFDEYVATYDVADLPHLLVIDLPGKRYWNNPPDFPLDDPHAVVQHLDAVLDGSLRPRYQGFRGFPDRLRHFYKSHLRLVNLGVVATLGLVVFLWHSLSSSSSSSSRTKAPANKDD